MVNARMLAQIRKSAETFLTDTCTIRREVTTPDAYGGVQRVQELVAADVRCRIITVNRQSASSTTITSDRETLRDEYRLSVLRTVPLGTDYMVTVEGVDYDVVRIETRLTDEVFHHAILHRRV